MFLRCCAGFVELIYYPLFAVFPVVVIGSAQLIVLRIRHLRSMIIRIANSLQTEFMQDELLICMRYHSSVVELVTSMNAATGYALLPLYLIVPILMAIFGSQIVLVRLKETSIQVH
ncbi:hypothetical protein HHI36_019751 [Cryptolaemus montrouzieri]|uniref:ABC transmembrane type-1 domain-containing protein n=1 Tax=Cryptolaemus montrouzieri TaxID=559131 RepID=A0ABD2N9S5_9CUCU